MKTRRTMKVEGARTNGIDCQIAARTRTACQLRGVDTGQGMKGKRVPHV
jgi:hypothetical protein